MFTLTQVDSQQYVALAPNGTVAGRGARSRALHGLPLRRGQHFLKIEVQPQFRGQGAGALLYAALERDAMLRGADSLACAVAAGDEAALRFATAQGFRIDYEMFDSELNLTGFDLSKWDQAVSRAETLGFRFTSLLQSQDEKGLLQNLYELDRHCSHDVPDWSGIMPPLAEYEASLQECDPEAVFIAWADGRPVGYTMTGADGYTHFLGVARAYRGKGIALALKVLTIRWALRKGVDRLTTNNNAANAAILDLNRKLGYVARPGTIYLIKDVVGVRTILREAAKTTVSLALFVGLYVWWQGWWYGVGMGAIILLHELGHMVAGRMRGVSLSSPLFIPFIGAFVSWKERPPNAYDEAFLAAGGPAAGIAASAAAWGLGTMLGVPELVNVAYLGFSIHIFNLLPVLPLDGGRMTGAVTRWVGYLFAPVWVFYCLWQGRPWLLGAFWSTLLSMLKPGDDSGYYLVPSAFRTRMLLTYMVLLGVSVLGVLGTHAGSGFQVPWLNFSHDGLDLEFALWVTGIITAGYLFWRFGRPIYGPWVTPVRHAPPVEQGQEER